MSSDDARRRAASAGLDLVEVSPEARPPVCKLMDYGRHKYEQARSDRAKKRNAADSAPKEVRFRPNTGKHDMEVKLTGARRFLEEGSRVKMTIRFRGAELRRQDVGRETLRLATETLADVGKLDNPIPEMQGRMLSVTISPIKGK